MATNALQENKMGVMPVGKLLVNMALPMIISMLVQAFYNVVDSIYVSQISESAVTALSLADTDVIGYAETETKACFAVLHFSGGNLLDKDYEIISLPDDRQEAVSSLLKQYYISRGLAPKTVSCSAS